VPLPVKIYNVNETIRMKSAARLDFDKRYTAVFSVNTNQFKKVQSECFIFL